MVEVQIDGKVVEITDEELKVLFPNDSNEEVEG